MSVWGPGRRAAWLCVILSPTSLRQFIYATAQKLSVEQPLAASTSSTFKGALLLSPKWWVMTLWKADNRFTRWRADTALKHDAIRSLAFALMRHWRPSLGMSRHQSRRGAGCPGVFSLALFLINDSLRWVLFLPMLCPGQQKVANASLPTCRLFQHQTIWLRHLC